MNININLPKALEQELNHLKQTTKKPKTFHVREALIRYLEDIEDIRDIEKYLAKKKQGKVKYYTSEEVKRHLKQHYNQK
jgi:RHH-type rel operon transcriptional repressor/antitoxin RelB